MNSTPPSTALEFSPVPQAAPAPVNVPENQPKRVSSFRLVNQPQTSDPPMSQGMGSVSPGTPVASTPAPPVFNPPAYNPPPVTRPALPNYQSQVPVIQQQPIIRQEPVMNTGMVQPAASNNTPVTMEMKGPNEIKAGDLVTFEIILRNPSAFTAKDVHAEAEVRGARLEKASTPQPVLKNGKMTWTFAAFPPRSERRFKVVMRTSTAECATTYMVWGPPVAEAKQARTTMSEPPFAGSQSQGLFVTVSGPSNAGLNEPVVFNVFIVNTTQQPILRPKLYVKLPAGLKHPDGTVIEGPMDTLMPGAREPIQVRAMAVQPGRHTLHCTVVGANAEAGLCQCQHHARPAGLAGAAATDLQTSARPGQRDSL